MPILIIVLIIFLLLSIALISLEPKKQKLLLEFSGGLWGGLLLQAFIVESQKYDPPTFFHLTLIIIGLILSVYLEYKNKFSFIYMICAMCAAAFLPSPIFISLLLISFLSEGAYFFTKDKGFNKSPLTLALITAGLFLAKGAIAVFPESSSLISSVAGGAVVYYASSKIAPNNHSSNLISVLGGLGGFFLGFIFYTH
ncbi:hypothetical protein [Anaeropeptidivorans aminofermentans]|jgi:hypothetical protein|uniref:hypothetical protein n=1 Tax=Anaeropeptidivorans aminofermentans TaxID=2934315 RepID=UPI002024A191|nr:hypothetical protein [Anaeropeptidivorans aminofermentans]MBE6012969.1 hypothetical protein [Lachnospiraceae bacterium]